MASSAPALNNRMGLAGASALARRAFRDARVRTVAFAYLFAVIAYIQPVGYRDAYPSLSSRLAFARSFADNKAIRLFYGVPHDLLTVSGYTAWRVGGTLAIFAAVFGLLAAVRALRTEEDTGRMELVLAAPVGRGTAYLSALAAIAAGVLVLGIAEFAGLVLAGLPAGGSAELALATASVVPVFAGVGALTSQLASTRRMALELGGAAVGLFLALRVIADTSTSAGWLRWATPLGWAEEMRPFTGAHPLVLLLPAAASVLLLLLAARIAAGRDIGTGVLPTHESAEPRLGLLSSPLAAGAALGARQPDRVALERRRVRVHRRCDRKEHIDRRNLKEPATRGREARHGLDRDAHRLSGVRVPVLRAGRQPVRLRADRCRASRGSRGEARDAALAPGRPPQVVGRAAPARSRRRHRDLPDGRSADLGGWRVAAASASP